MLYYDDHDYLNYEDIEDLYENNIVFEDVEEVRSSWEYGYHNITDELVDD
jgi:hypothetical protein